MISRNFYFVSVPTYSQQLKYVTLILSLLRTLAHVFSSLRLSQFEITYAPWTLIDLPLPRTPTPYVRPPHPLNHYMTDPTPHSRLIHIPHYGIMKPLCPPVLAHAAILNFFARVDKLLGVASAEADAGGRDLTGGMDGPQVGPEAQGGGGAHGGAAAEAEVGEGGEGTALGEGAGHIAGFRPRTYISFLNLTI